MCKQAAFDLFGQVKDARHFWIPDILWILQPLFYNWECLNSTPMAECIAGHIQTECSLSSKDVPALCMWGFAHVCSLRNVVLFFTRHLWIFFEAFSQPIFLTVMKSLAWVVFLATARSHGWLWNTAVSSVWLNHEEWIWLCNVICFFSPEEALLSWSEKPCPSASCKNICTCLKNFRETACPFGSSWRPCMMRGRPHTNFSMIFARSIPRDPLWCNTT